MLFHDLMLVREVMTGNLLRLRRSVRLPPDRLGSRGCRPTPTSELDQGRGSLTDQKFAYGF